MNEELERTRKALGEAIAWLQQLSTLGGTSSVGNKMAREGLDKVEFLLNPPPIFEEKVAEIWAVIDTTNGKIWNTGTKEEMEVACFPGPANLLKVIQLTGPYHRPVRRAMILEYEVAAKVLKNHPVLLDGTIVGVGGEIPIFADQPECHGKAGVLIFRTAE